MREFVLDISDSFSRGIAPDKRLAINQHVLMDAYNVQATEFGLRAFEGFVDPFMGSFPLGDFPDGQLFIGKKEAVLLKGEKIYRVDISSIPYQFSEITDIDTKDRGASNTTSTNAWHFVDAGDFWMLLDGDRIYVKDVSETLNFEDVKHLKLLNSGIQTGSYHRGRILLGGFTDGSIWNQGWMNLLEEVKREQADPINLPYGDIKENYVLWSSIGGGDFPLWLFKPEMAVFGPLTNYADYGFDLDAINRTYMMDILRRNELGWMPMPWEGEVLGMAPLRDKVIVLGTGGVTGLYLSNSTYGVHEISNLGLASRSAFGYSNTECIYIDREGSLHIINWEFQAKRLGYKQQFKSMLGTNIVITYDEERRFWYISNGSVCYSLSKEGLTRVNSHPTSLHFRDGSIVGLHSTDGDEGASVTSNWYDVGVRGLKNVMTISSRIKGGTNVRMMLEFVYSSNEPPRTTEWRQTNKEGNVFFGVNCLAFRIHVVSDTHEDIEIDSLNVRYQIADLRAIRGTYASPVNS